MDKFFPLLKGSFNRMQDLGPKAASSRKNILTVAVIFLAAVSLVPIYRLMSAIYGKISHKSEGKPKDTSENESISKSKESMDYFKNSCATPEFLNNKKALDYVNTQQFSALRAFGQAKIAFRSLDTILRFGLQDLEQISLGEDYETLDEYGVEKAPIACHVMSKYMALNPALLDSKQSFNFDLRVNSLADISGYSVEHASSLKGQDSRLTSEEKVLYVGLGIIGAYNNMRETSKYIEENKKDMGPTEKEEFDEIMLSKEKILSEYTEAYVNLCKKGGLNLEALVARLDKETLLDRMEFGSGLWGGPTSSVIDKTSMLLMLKKTLTLKKSGEMNLNNKSMITDMIIDREEFSHINDGEDVDNLKDKIRHMDFDSGTYLGRSFPREIQ